MKTKPMFGKDPKAMKSASVDSKAKTKPKAKGMALSKAMKSKKS